MSPTSDRGLGLGREEDCGVGNSGGHATGRVGYAATENASAAAAL